MIWRIVGKPAIVTTVTNSPWQRWQTGHHMQQAMAARPTHTTPLSHDWILWPGILKNLHLALTDIIRIYQPGLIPADSCTHNSKQWVSYRELLLRTEHKSRTDKISQLAWKQKMTGVGKDREMLPMTTVGLKQKLPPTILQSKDGPKIQNLNKIQDTYDVVEKEDTRDTGIEDILLLIKKVRWKDNADTI